MFDFEIYIGPAVVLLAMVIGLLGFAIWGARAIRESTPPDLAPAAEGPEVAPSIDGASAAPTELTVPELPPETTAEFSEPLVAANAVASFSQSFWEGQEVPPVKHDDYNEAIDRIKAGLNAADASEFNKEAVDSDVVAAASVLEALRHGVVATDTAAEQPAHLTADPGENQPAAAGLAADGQEDIAKENAIANNNQENINQEASGEENITEEKAVAASEDTVENITAAALAGQTAEAAEEAAETAEAETAAAETEVTEAANQEGDEITRMISPEEKAAILAQEPEPGENMENVEATRLLSREEAAAISSLPETPAEKPAGQAGFEPADLELTRMHRPAEQLPVDEPPAAPTVGRGAAALSAPPGRDFGFVNNHAMGTVGDYPASIAGEVGQNAGQPRGMASAVNLMPTVDLSSLASEEAGDTLLPESPVPFGPKMAWLAIPGFKPSEIIATLRLNNVEPANWTTGLRQAYADNNQVFVSPSLGVWVLVIGKTLWDRADMSCSAENIPWLKDICRKFSNACFFSTMRGLGNHGWIGIRDGQIVRAYGYSSELQELIWLMGEPTEEEIAINPAFITEMREKYQPGFRPVIPDEKLVLAVAAAWSVDPSFRRRQYPADFGFVGSMN